MAKILITPAKNLSDQKAERTKEKVAGLLGVLPEDVILLPEGISVSVLDVPSDLTDKREEADAQAEQQTQEGKPEEPQAPLPPTAEEPPELAQKPEPPDHLPPEE